ncbi:NadS family protein [Rosenbergiella collisarenosi]|uniref:NadS family protein n=1 Tax=Rosenbergiella collisarenosi TaxID=1544695 RepID=UPI001BD9EC20|nr:NadS family protein [Rosenbergiella collisarenosi]MBT0720971.1 helix-turn-helix domain-containing protein [Rosenbergiella collisarenosi]
MKDEMFDELIESMKQAVSIRRGEIDPSRVTSYSIPDVKAIRDSVGMKQNEFAQAVGVSPSLVQSWEQHKRIPHGSNLKMLRVIEKHPDVLQMFIQA